MNYKKEYKFKLTFSCITLLLIMLNTGITLGQGSESNFCSHLLPKEAIILLNNKYVDWRILSYDDLHSDDKMLWNKKHDKECPGIAIGKYRTATESDYAVLIIPKKNTTKEAKLLTLNKVVGEKLSVKLLYEDKNITNYPVIYKSNPGQYYDFYDSKKSIVTKNDVIIYEHIEASAIVFYYIDGKYKQLLTSD